MNRLIQAYLYPFVIENKLNHPKMIGRISDYIAGRSCKKEIEACRVLPLGDFFAHVTPEEERAFIRGILESRTLMFHDDYVSSGINRAYMLMLLDNYMKNVWHESIKVRAGFRLSWNLFAHLVFGTLYDNSSLYPDFADKINKQLNLFKYLFEVKKIATKSKCHKLQVGAILVNNGQIKICGWNGHPADTRLDHICLRENTDHGTDISHGYCCHAEMQVLLKSNPTQLKKGTLFITHPPCEHCTRHIIQARIPLVVFLCGDYPLYGPEMAWRLGGRTRFYGV